MKGEAQQRRRIEYAASPVCRGGAGLQQSLNVHCLFASVHSTAQAYLQRHAPRGRAQFACSGWSIAHLQPSTRPARHPKMNPERVATVSLHRAARACLPASKCASQVRYSSFCFDQVKHYCTSSLECALLYTNRALSARFWPLVLYTLALYVASCFESVSSVGLEHHREVILAEHMHVVRAQHREHAYTSLRYGPTRA